MTLQVLKSSFLALAPLVSATPSPARHAEQDAAAPIATIPFELVNQHIMLKVTVNDSQPLSFVFDTGDKFGVIDLDRAKALALTLGGEVRVKGTSAEGTAGAFVTGAQFRVAGLADFSQPVKLAIPLQGLTPRFGHDFDGILGSDFITEFVVEIDYPGRKLRLHDKEKFTYAGPGESVPITFNAGGHPVVEAEIELAEDQRVAGRFVIDIGSGGALTLYSPFVAQHELPRPGTKSIRAIGSGGVGGAGTGRLGRVRSLKIGKSTFSNPTALFSQDTAGANAASEVFGSIGARVMKRFKVYLDYSHSRIVLEPNAGFAEPFDQANSGLVLDASGAGFHTFRITEVLEDSPAADAGLRADDLVEAVDGRAASELTLTQLMQMFELSKTYKLAVRRGEQSLALTLTPKPLT